MLVVVAGFAGWWWFWPSRGHPSAEREAPASAHRLEGSAGLRPAIAGGTAALPGATPPGSARGQPGNQATRQPGNQAGPITPAVDKPRLVADEQLIIPAKSATQRACLPSLADAASRLELTGDPDPNEPSGTQGSAATHPAEAARSGHRDIEAARRLYESGKLLEARGQLNALLARGLDEADSAEARRLLTRIADDTLFGQRSVTDDPLVDSYTVQAGDVLINIGKNCAVPHEVLMFINGISDPGKIRAGQQLKVLRGPFHARIYKSKFRLDIYLQDVYVRSYPVGLGTQNGTPEGVWRVKNRLENPTYYPPASAEIKRIVPPDDPTNPLGERWIGLEGIEGAAAGQVGYGIHGTIEPQSIGKSVSLGCIRMQNEDVAFLYNLMLPGRSTVTILP
jgi:LysM repeat protein